ncbi:MAG TPA: hypothetical protein VG605_07745, partial [Puia sp.]|nr:hypothetical protein [Puia sp.]
MFRLLTLLSCTLFTASTLLSAPGPAVRGLLEPVGGPSARTFAVRGSSEPVRGLSEPAPAFRSGWWRAYLERKDGQQIVFNFEVTEKGGKQVMYIRNAGERLLVDDITYEGDSVVIRMPFYESQLRARITSDGNLEGL